MIKFRVNWLHWLGQRRKVALIQNRLHELKIRYQSRKAPDPLQGRVYPEEPEGMVTLT